jgi:hypothetical protein
MQTTTPVQTMQTSIYTADLRPDGYGRGNVQFAKTRPPPPLMLLQRTPRPAPPPVLQKSPALSFPSCCARSRRGD